MQFPLALNQIQQILYKSNLYYSTSYCYLGIAPNIISNEPDIL